MPDLYCSSFLPQFAVLLQVFVHVPTIWECSPTQVTVTTRNMIFGRGSRLLSFIFLLLLGGGTYQSTLSMRSPPAAHLEVTRNLRRRKQLRLSPKLLSCVELGFWYMGGVCHLRCGEDGELEELLASMFEPIAASA